MNIMKSDVAILQNIANTLKQETLASQRVLADNAGISIGLMNSVLNRFVERGWIMLTNVNLRKLSYAVTPEGKISCRLFMRHARCVNKCIIHQIPDNGEISVPLCKPFLNVWLARKREGGCWSLFTRVYKRKKI